MANTFTVWLADKLLHGPLKRIVDGRPPDLTIGEAEAPYMHRWWVIPRNRWFNVYLHNVVRDDDPRALHDHPWASVSLMLSGVLGEVYQRDVDGLGAPQEFERLLHPGDVVWRSARFAHRLYLSKAAPHHEAWTLFVTGPRIREWGFHCPRGWVDWRVFTSMDESNYGDSSKIGRGCE